MSIRNWLAVRLATLAFRVADQEYRERLHATIIRGMS